MMAYWANFARSGTDPNGSGLPNWPRYSRESYRILSGTQPEFPYAEGLGPPFAYDKGAPGIGKGTPSIDKVAKVDCDYFHFKGYRLMNPAENMMSIESEEPEAPSPDPDN